MTILRADGYNVLGTAVAIHRKTIAAVATQGSGPHGAVLVFRKRPGGWAHTSQPAAILSDPGTLVVQDPISTIGLALSRGALFVGWNQDQRGPSGAFPSVIDEYPARHGRWTSTAQPAARLRAPEQRSTDGTFGHAMSVSGSTLVVGQPGLAVNGVEGIGAAYVYLRNSKGLVRSMNQAEVLRPTNPRVDEFFGFSVAIQGSQAVVGAPYRDHLPITSTSGHQGGAYVFRRPSGGWAGSRHQDAFLTQRPNPRVGPLLGWAVATTGSTIVAGEPLRPSGQTVYAGAAVLFRRPAGGWQGKVRPDRRFDDRDVHDYDRFGAAVATSGREIVVGKPHDLHPNPDLAPSSGLYIYDS
ncbi:MAG: hypothetical protein JO214_08120 [Frankiaceae bacterium]|nr:hypothetical protein [Frankiaceae bacterium]